MNAGEEIKQQVAAELAAGEEAVRKSRVRFACFQTGIGLLLALLGVACLLLSHFPNGMIATSLLIFGGTAMALRALYDLKKQKQHTPSAHADTPLF